MNGKERVRRAMALEVPDRVPVFCQLSIGHYFLHSGIDPVEIWFSSEGLAEALVRLQRRYGFDGILVNLPGRDPDWKSNVSSIERKEDHLRINWLNDAYTILPNDDLPHYYPEEHSRQILRFDEIEPDELFYVEPWDITGPTYSRQRGFVTEQFPELFPPYYLDTIHRVKQKTQGEVSIHSEVFSPWSQLFELFQHEAVLMAMIDDTEKVHACLERLTEGAISLGRMQAQAEVDAVLISSAFAGGGFISRRHYETFVLPYERKIIQDIQSEFLVPVYTHTCGRIGDRLDLMLETGTNGIDTLDPPPLGNVLLEEAKEQLSGRAFIKGNIDPVNTLLKGTLEEVREDIRYRVQTGKRGGGYILSSACSVAPHTPPAHLQLLGELVDQYGQY